MPLHEDNKLPPHGDHLPPHGQGEVDASHGYERSDVRTTGIVVFLTALAIFVVVTAVLCWGIGKAFNAYMNKEDGPNTKWTKSEDVAMLEHYTRIDGQAGKVRIPIERAMELIAQRGLPVAPPAQNGTIMAGDRQPVVQAPLTTGFARTAYELEQVRGEGAHAERPPNQK
jgi:hypothetical protein